MLDDVQMSESEAAAEAADQLHPLPSSVKVILSLSMRNLRASCQISVSLVACACWMLSALALWSHVHVTPLFSPHLLNMSSNHSLVVKA